MHPLDPDFAFPDLRPALLQIDPSLPDAFHFRAEQGDAAFVFFLYEIIVPRFAVLRDDFDSLLMRHTAVLPDQYNTSFFPFQSWFCLL